MVLCPIFIMAYLTLQNLTVNDWQYGGSTAYLYIWASQSFYEATTGEYIAQGQVGNTLSPCQIITCTVSSTTLTIPEVVLASTTDSTVPNATYTATLASASGRLVYPLLQDFFVDPEYLESSVQASVEMASAGTAAINGLYTYRGQTGGYNYYNLQGQATSTTLFVVKNDGSQWIVTSSAGTTMYTTVSQEDLPWDGGWEIASGAANAPNVSENADYVSGTWEQLTLSNQGISAIPPSWPGPFWNVPQTKEYVNSLVGDGTTPLASATVIGKTALDENPVLSTDPKAVAINSNRISRVLSEDYSNNLATAVVDIGATPTTLIIKEDVTLSTAVVIPATLFLEFQNGAIVTKSLSGAIDFAGVGLVDPLCPLPCFSNFGNGAIQWSGTVYPRSISTTLISSPTSVSTAIARLDAAFVGKQVEIVASPGAITTQTTLTQYHTLRFTAGVFTNTATAYPQFILADDTRVVGAGMTRTIIRESQTATYVGIFYADSVDVNPFDGKNYNIEISDLTIQTSGSRAVDQAQSSIHLGNCTNGHVRRVYFDTVAGFGVVMGGFGTSGNYAEGSSITDCVFNDVGTQNCGVLNGKDCLIANNIFFNIGLTGSQGITVIDCEPNDFTDVLEGIQIVNNIIDCRGGTGSHYGITVQSGGAENVRNNRISDNLLIGGENTGALTKKFALGISLVASESSIVENNFITFCSQAGIGIRNCTTATASDNTLQMCGAEGSVVAFGVIATFSSWLTDNLIQEVATAGSQDFTITESEDTCTVNVTAIAPTVVTRTGGQASFQTWWAGKTVTINAVDYTVSSMTGNNEITLTGAVAGVPLTGVTLTTKFCTDNIYKDNQVDSIVLSSAGTSRIIADGTTLGTAVSPAQITANQNNYNPSPTNGGKYQLIRVTTDASRNITGLAFTKNWAGASTASPHQSGDCYTLVNVGSFNVVLVNQSASSTAANRFLTDTGSDITLIPKESAYFIYDATTARFRVYKNAGTITASELPTGIDAVKIADGSVSNTEFQYLNGVTSAIQTQMDLKAPLISPSFTTPVLGVATGTSLATTGLIKSSGTAGIGYATGAGGAQTQATDKSTGVTSNTITTAITMNGAALNLDTAVSFTFTNSTIAATDTVLVTHQSAGTSGAYVCNAFPGAGSAVITVRNVSTGNLSEAIVLRVTVIKSVSS